MRGGTGLHGSHIVREIADKLRQALARQLLAQSYPATRIGSKNMEDMLCQIDTQEGKAAVDENVKSASRLG